MELSDVSTGPTTHYTNYGIRYVNVYVGKPGSKFQYFPVLYRIWNIIINSLAEVSFDGILIYAYKGTIRNSDILVILAGTNFVKPPLLDQFIFQLKRNYHTSLSRNTSGAVNNLTQTFHWSLQTIHFHLQPMVQPLSLILQNKYTPLIIKHNLLNPNCKFHSNLFNKIFTI